MSTAVQQRQTLDARKRLHDALEQHIRDRGGWSEKTGNCSR